MSGCTETFRAILPHCIKPICTLGRAFLGIFEAPIESIAPRTITDIFYLHERGEKVFISGLSVLGGNELGPMFSAFIIQYLGMNWAFYIVAISIAITRHNVVGYFSTFYLYFRGKQIRTWLHHADLLNKAGLR